MEMQPPESTIRNDALAAPLLAEGTPVIYGLHGRCTVIAVDSRIADGQTLSFYRLEIVRSPLSRSTRREPTISIPVATAATKGLRLALRKDQIDEPLQILASREYFLSLVEPWSSAREKLETLVRIEGAAGLAKAWSYLYVLTRRQLVNSTEVTRLLDTVSKQLLTELSDASGESTKELETRIIRSMRPKLFADQ